MHAEVAVKHLDAADGTRAVVIVAQRAIFFGDEDRRRQERLEKFLAGHRPGARAAAAMGRGKSLVQVQVHHVHAEIAGARLAYQRVHVGAIHVKQAALCMHKIGNLVNFLFEDAERIGIGEHDGGDIFVHLRGQRTHVYHAGGIGF